MDTVNALYSVNEIYYSANENPSIRMQHSRTWYRFCDDGIRIVAMQDIPYGEWML